jgi:flagellin
MALSVLNNIASIQSQNQLNATSVNMNKTLFKLSSGLRIATGADDAAGLSIANGLQAQVKALNQATRNANDGMSYLQVADGALAEVHNLLVRAVTLAEESANGTLSSVQRKSVELEFQQIQSEIDRIGTKTTFNGTTIFSGTAISIFVGDTSSTSTIAFTAQSISKTSIKDGQGGGTDVKLSDAQWTLSTASTAQAALSTLNTAISNIASQRAVLGAASNRLQAAVSVIASQSQNLQAAESQIRDANMAEEVASLTKWQILNQTGIASLAQANQAAQSVLALFR